MDIPDAERPNCEFDPWEDIVVEDNGYEEPVFEEGEPGQPGWCRKGEFNYQDYSYEPPCAGTKSEFDSILESMDVFSEDDRRSWTECTGY